MEIDKKHSSKSNAKINKMSMPRESFTFLIYMMIFLLQIDLSLTSCGRAEYNIGGQCCPMCAPGNRVYKHCTEYSSTFCIPCINGDYLDEPNGLTRCFICTHCDAGLGLRVKRPCTTTSDTVCEPLEGYYCIETRKGCIAAQKHSGCKPGQYISQRGTEQADTVCMDCTGETYSDGTFTLCKEHRKCNTTEEIINPGNLSSDTECGAQRSNRGIIAGLVCLSLLFTLGFLLFCFFLKRKNKKTNSGVEKTLTPDGTPAHSQDQIKNMLIPIQDTNNGLPHEESKTVIEEEHRTSKVWYEVS